MSLQLFSNNAISLLANNLSASGMSIQLQAGMGNQFPQPTAPGEYFLITLEDIDAPLNREIIRISGRAADVLTVSARAQEGTTARNWVAFDTLVDHRITAETIRQAFLQPVASGGGSGGIETPPVVVEPAWSQDVASVVYSNSRRGNKFWVSMYSPTNGRAQSFEVLTVVQGILGSNDEIVTWTRTNRVGYNFSGNVQVNLDKPNNTLLVSWNNTEAATDVVVTVVRI